MTRPIATAAAAVAAILAVASCGGANDAAPAGPSSERMTLRPAGSVEGAPLGYVEYVPPGYGAGDARPLLVFTHGSGENGDGSEAALERVLKLGIPALIRDDEWPEERPFVVLMPQYAPQHAEECAHAELLESFIAFAIDEYDVDPERVYLTGISCGAIGIWDYVGEHGDEAVAAAVPIAGHAEWALAEVGCELGRVPIWAFHGARDEIVPERHIAGPVAKLKKCTDPPSDELRLTVYPEADHDAWGRTYDLSAGHDIYAWLLRHERGS